MLAEMSMEEKTAQLSCTIPLTYLKNETVDILRVTSAIPNSIGRMTQVATGFFSDPKKIAEGLCTLQEIVQKQSRFGIPALFQLETLTGVNACNATIFPAPLSVASTWEPNYAYQMGDVIQKQMRAIGAHIALAPVSDVCRNAHFGRSVETYGEDVLLNSDFSAALVQGIQKDGKVLACAKHFLAYADSDNGLNMSAISVGRRALRDVYAKPFAKMIQEADLQNIMVTYSAIDGVPVTVNKDIIATMLRKELQFQGIVLCDATSIEKSFSDQGIGNSLADVAKLAIENTIDADTPLTKSYLLLPELVKNGQVQEEDINQSVRRVLAQKQKLQLFHPQAEDSTFEELYYQESYELLSQKIAEEAVILLKNDNGILPLQTNKAIAVIGPHADKVTYLLGGYSYPKTLDLLLEVARNNGGSMEGFLEILRQIVDVEDIKRVTQFDEEKTNTTLLEDYVKRTYHTKSIADAIGKQAGKPTMCAEGCDITGLDRSQIAEALHAAKQAEIIVMTMGGLNGFSMQATSGEGKARCDLRLPGIQEDLIREIAGLQKPMILVLINGRPMDISKIEPFFAVILEVWINGPYGSAAIANVLFGKVNPSGRLPMSMPAHSAQTPLTYAHHAGSGYQKLETSHGIAQYSDMKNAPMYHFGYGLSYASFVYGGFQANEDNGTVHFTVQVKNISAVSGKEVVQIYMRHLGAFVTRPIKELVAYQKVWINANASVEVQLKMDIKDFTYCMLDGSMGFESGTLYFYLSRDAGNVLMEQSIVYQA